MTRLLEGKTAVITGTNRGIGKAILEHYARQGCHVIACARKYDEAFESELRRLSEENQVDIIPVYFDLSQSEQIKEGVKQIKATGKTIDILVNNAGILSDYQRFNMIAMAKVKEVFDVDYFAQIELTQYISRFMMKNRNGSIIFISSIAATEAFFSSFDYVASKAAIEATMRQLSRELGQSNIRVNALAPGLIMTDMIKDNNQERLNEIVPAINLGRFGTASEVADVAVFLGSDMSSYMTGQVIKVDGGTKPPRANW